MSRQPGLRCCLWRLTSTPDKLSQPCQQQVLQASTGLTVHKLFDRHIDISIVHMARNCSHPAARFNTQRNPRSAQDWVKSYKIWEGCGCLTLLHILDCTLEKTRQFNFLGTNHVEETHDSLISYLISKRSGPCCHLEPKNQLSAKKWSWALRAA